MLAPALQSQVDMHLYSRLILLGFAVLLTGCSAVKRGDLTKVSATSPNARVGNVYLVRGLVGIFSTGMDELGAKIRADGVSAQVYQGEQRRQLAEAIIAAYGEARNAEPLVLIGHSYGADDVIRIAHELESAGIKVDLLVTCDAVTPPKVPSNIRSLRNYYKPQGALDKLPWLRGVPLEADPQGAVELANYDLTGNRRDLLERGTNHFNIEKNAKLHADVLAQLKEVCPPRPAWAARRHAKPPAAPIHAVSNPTPDTQPQPVRSPHAPRVQTAAVE